LSKIPGLVELVVIPGGIFQVKPMAMHSETSDDGLIALLRERGSLGISDLIAAMHVTATAVRQRLNRLMHQGLVQRQTTKHSRGRPSHCYSLTEKGRRQTASNFADLTIALWREIRAVKDAETRRGLLERIAKTMARLYDQSIHGNSTAERMQSVSALMADRNVPFAVEHRGSLPVLTAHACPYPELAEQDRGICSVEKMLFSELLGEKVRLSDCRLDGANCCRFETN
jgi:predicted ArsR family transcriptional regulator